MSDFYPVYLYFGLICIATCAVLAVSYIFPSIKDSSAKFMTYESGIKTHANLMQERFAIQHYLVALLFLLFDVEIVFLYPWAVVCKLLGSFAFYEMVFFMAILLIGFAYIWRKKGLQWQ